MPRQLISKLLCICYLLIVFHVFPVMAAETTAGSQKIFSSEKELKALTEEILSFSQNLAQKTMTSEKKIEMMNQKSEAFAKTWEELIKSGKAREEDLKNPHSTYSKALQVMTHFILLTKLKASKATPPTASDCKDKKLQMEYDYQNSDSSKVLLSEEDKVLEALRRNLCRE